MEKREIDLTGMICPYPVTHIIYEVDNMEEGDGIKFLVDDPLAVKSVPEELEDYEDLRLDVRKKDKRWEILVDRD